MPAYFESGFCVRRPSWHGEETLLADYPESVDDARLAAGLLWEPKLIPVYQRTLITAGAELPAGALVVGTHADGSHDVMLEVEDFHGVARDDTGAVLGVPTRSFQPVYTREMFAIAEAIERVPGATVKYETAGSVKGGAVVFILVYLDEPWQAPGDSSLTLPFFAIVNHNDGSGACRGIFTSVRVVCWNTVQAAEAQGERSGQAFVIRHTGSTADRVEAAKDAVAELRSQTELAQLQAMELASINVSDALVQQFFEEWIPTPEHATARLVESRRQRREQLWQLYSSSPTTDEIRGTAYGLFQTCTEYLDHLRPVRSADSYLARTMLGSGDSGRVKAQTLRTIREMAAVGVS